MALLSHFAPHLSLIPPVSQLGNRAKVAFGDRVASFSHWREVQYRFLDVRRQVQQVHDLCHAGLGDVGEAGQFGLVGDLAVAQEFVEPDGQGHQLRHAGSAAGVVDQNVACYSLPPVSAGLRIRFDEKDIAESFEISFDEGPRHDKPVRW